MSAPRAPQPGGRQLVITNWKDTRHPAAGGAEVFCENLARELVALGHQVTLLVSRPQGLPRREYRDDITVRRMGGTFTVYPLVLLWLLLHRRRVDAVIDSQNGIPFFTPLVVRRRCPAILLIHHVHQQQFALYFSGAMARVGRWLEGPVSRRVYGARTVCAVSPSSRQAVRQQLRLRGEVQVIPNGSGGVAAVATRAAAPTICCVGRLVPHKRWHLLLEAVRTVAADVDGLRVELVGTGSEAPRLARLVDHYGLSEVVRLHGYLDAAERDRLLGSAWLTVSTSVGEGWGLSMIEAAARGVPAVAIDVPGLRDSVRDGVTGWLTGVDQLAGTVSTALGTLRDPAEQQRLSEACLRWAGSLSWVAAAQRFSVVLDAEQGRLTARPERRRARTDLATVVTLTHSSARSLALSRLRITDQTTFCPRCLGGLLSPPRVLLHGTDEHRAVSALRRCGATEAVAARVLRPNELLSWAGPAPAHSMIAGWCPVTPPPGSECAVPETPGDRAAVDLTSGDLTSGDLTSADLTSGARG